MPRTRTLRLTEAIHIVVGGLPDSMARESSVMNRKMWLVPCHCHACHASFLQPREAIDSAGTTGCACGAAACALPGESYRESDRSLFDAVVAFLSASGLTGMHAARLALELERCQDMAPAGRLARLGQLCPTLEATRLTAGMERASARKTVGMFVSLLQALSVTHRRSDISALVSQPMAKER